jgi:drug/metabolite transporter (DMT)-like permease
VPRAPTTGDWLTLLVLTIFWGSAFMFNAIALQSFSPSMLVAVRITIAAAILFIYMRACGIRLPEPGPDIPVVRQLPRPGLGGRRRRAVPERGPVFVGVCRPRADPVRHRAE